MWRLIVHVKSLASTPNKMGCLRKSVQKDMVCFDPYFRTDMRID